MIQFDAEMEKYIYEYEGLQFLTENKPTEATLQHYQELARAYREQLPNLIAFMLPELQDVYGPHSVEEVSQKLGKPQIDDDLGRISYLEHTFDDIHIFDIEYLGSGFTELYLFGIDG